MGAICSLILTLFIGIGSIIEGNAGHLSNQKLPLREDGCYINETTTESTILSEISPRFNKQWKDVEYSDLNNLFGISYLWLPAITVSSAIIFGLIFSMVINIWRKPPPVKAKYMTPMIVTMWRKILGEERIRHWVDFSDENDENNSIGNNFCKSESITYLNNLNNNIQSETVISSRRNSNEKSYGSILPIGAHQLKVKILSHNSPILVKA